MPGRARGAKLVHMVAAYRPPRLHAALGLGLLVSCSGAQDNFADMNWTEDQHHRVAGRDASSLFQSDVTEIDRSQYVLRGVRHDVTASKTATLTARCSCLDVVIGAAEEPRFQWAGERPRVAPNDVVLAIRTEGSMCPGGRASGRRPSIEAVDLVDGDVIVTVEELPQERPQALGAVIPSPAVGSGLYVRSKKSKTPLPYARSKVKHGMCRVYVRRASKGQKTSK